MLRSLRKPMQNLRSHLTGLCDTTKKELVMSGNNRLNFAPVASVCAAFLAGMVTLAPAPGLAQAVFDGSKARVNLAGKLRSLTQQVTSASCRLTAQIDMDNAREELRVSLEDFATILGGLENGNLTLGIPSAERSRRALKALKGVKDTWDPVRTASTNILANAGSAADLAVIAGANEALKEATIVLSTEITGEYTNPQELLQSDAMSIGIAGRQSMLANQIATNVCGIATKTTALGTPADLTETVGVFQVSLAALQTGLPDAGINPPPNDAIKNELAAVSKIWEAKQSDLLALSSADSISPEGVAATAEFAHTLMDDMQNVVTLYMLSTPGQEDVYRVPLAAYAENELKKWLSNPELIQAINEQNVRHASLSQADIDQLDLDWRAQRKAGGGDLITDLLSRPSSEWLRQQSAATAGFVTEVFVMDNRGLNVAQSVETSDYWQGDEGKWQNTFGDGSGNMDISEVEFDDSTQFYQSQASLPIYDPATGQMIGAITFGINVQRLL